MKIILKVFKTRQQFLPPGEIFLEKIVDNIDPCSKFALFSRTLILVCKAQEECTA